MKKKKYVFLILCLIFLFIIGIIIYFVIKPQYYNLNVNMNKSDYDNAEGILVNGFFQDAFYLNAVKTSKNILKRKNI
ncbi:MAG: hypothetical protein IJ501_05710 [Bacilli bacterium]|nr:hypothetical protein [Bacilli bacterium]